MYIRNYLQYHYLILAKPGRTIFLLAEKYVVFDIFWGKTHSEKLWHSLIRGPNYTWSWQILFKAFSLFQIRNSKDFSLNYFYFEFKFSENSEFSAKCIFSLFSLPHVTCVNKATPGKTLEPGRNISWGMIKKLGCLDCYCFISYSLNCAILPEELN